VVQACFQIELHSKDQKLLEDIKIFFNNKGFMTKYRNSIKYRISKLDEIIDIIIPHFEKYPLISQKFADFFLFKDIIKLMSNKEHLTKEGMIKIINIKASLNNGLSNKLITLFPDKIKTYRAKSIIPDIINSN
jgi:hypothetical protein